MLLDALGMIAQLIALVQGGVGATIPGPKVSVRRVRASFRGYCQGMSRGAEEIVMFVPGIVHAV